MLYLCGMKNVFVMISAYLKTWWSDHGEATKDVVGGLATWVAELVAVCVTVPMVFITYHFSLPALVAMGVILYRLVPRSWEGLGWSLSIIAACGCLLLVMQALFLNLDLFLLMNFNLIVVAIMTCVKDLPRWLYYADAAVFLLFAIYICV